MVVVAGMGFMGGWGLGDQFSSGIQSLKQGQKTKLFEYHSESFCLQVCLRPNPAELGGPGEQQGEVAAGGGGQVRHQGHQQHRHSSVICLYNQ